MGHSLEESLDSLIKQLPDESEIVVVDGGSTDQSQDILEEYEQKYDVFRYEISEEGTLGHDRNLGTDLAKGDVLFHKFDCDERLIEGAVEQATKHWEDEKDSYDEEIFLSIGTFTVARKSAFEEIRYGDVYRAEDREHGRRIRDSDEYRRVVVEEKNVEDIFETSVPTEMRKHWIAIYSEFVNGLSFRFVLREFVLDHNEVSFKSRVYHLVFVVLNYFRYKFARFLDRFR
jgi:glycosyltransferase involved in cell wall biosynthesis